MEVKPDFKIEDYFGLKIDGKREEVKEEEVEERLKGLQNLYANLKTIPEPRPIRSGDFVIVDYEASMNGKPLDEGRATDYTVEVGSGRFIPAFEEKLVGLKTGEEKEIEVSFPEDYGIRNGPGKRSLFTPKSKRSRKRSFPLLMTSLRKILEITLLWKSLGTT